MTTIAKELLTRKDVAALCQVSPLTIIRWEASGRLPAIRLGAGTVRYRKSDVEALIASSLTPNS